jgi:hypothetical protein
MSLIGVTAIFFAFGGYNKPDIAPNLIVGFGFGASFVALFAQLGGGIYTKAADVGADLVGKVESGIPEDDPRNPDKIGTGYTLQATAGALTKVSSAFNIAAGPPANLTFSVQPVTTAAYKYLLPKVLLTDAAGNPIAAQNVTLAILNNPSGGTLAGTTTQATGATGAAAFALTINNPGTGYTLKATAGALTATSSAFDITAALPAKLGFLVQPTNTMSGNAIPAVKVQVLDAGGNLVPTATPSITMVLATRPVGATSFTAASTTTVTAVAGVATFSNLVLTQVGAYTLLANAPSGIGGATSNTFNITPKPSVPSKLAFVGQPKNATSGASINGSTGIQVAIKDASGATVTSATDMVTLDFGTNPISATLSGTLTVAAVNGIATFKNVSIDLASVGYTLTAKSGALSSAASSSFTITAGAAAKLMFSLQPPSSVAAKALFRAKVSVLDAKGNLVKTPNVSVTLTANGGAGTLSGGVVTSSGGVANYYSLAISKAGSYVLHATATGLTAVDSTGITVN